MYKVVVVEDESMVRKGIILTIDWSALDCVVVGDAANGEEGVELVDRLKPDIVVSDVKMPRMDGLTAMQAIREIDEEVPIIAVSAHAFEQDRRTAYACGCNAYVTKPVDIHELTSTISLLLSIKEHHDSI